MVLYGYYMDMKLNVKEIFTAIQVSDKKECVSPSHLELTQFFMKPYIIHVSGKRVSETVRVSLNIYGLSR